MSIIDAGDIHDLVDTLQEKNHNAAVKIITDLATYLDTRWRMRAQDAYGLEREGFPDLHRTEQARASAYRDAIDELLRLCRR